MAENLELISTIYEGWHTYQNLMTDTIGQLDADHLMLRASPHLRSVGEIAAHVISARARWFFLLMGEGGEAFKTLGKWDRRGAKARTPEEFVAGLQQTWTGMHEAIARWNPEEWDVTWPGEDDSEPEIITRQWVIWHLIEHDLHHGGEISLTLVAHGIAAMEL